MIEFSHVSFSYDDRAMMKDVSFRLDDGKFVGILGPNGGGKSTFLKLALGILKPQSGSLKVTDQIIAYLSQTTGADDHDFQCTVEELVGMGLIGRKKWFLNRKDKEKIQAALERFDLLPLRKKLLRELSGGQLQRARLAKTIVADPTLVIFDEPDAGLDEENHHHLVSLINELHHEGKTILFVSHHPHDLEEADEVYFIEDGEIVTYQHELERGHHHVSL